MGDNDQQSLGSRIQAQFAHLGGVDLDGPDPGELAADLERRARIADLFVTGDWRVELETFEADQERERQQGWRPSAPRWLPPVPLLPG
jgi:hypothetical protein